MLDRQIRAVISPGLDVVGRRLAIAKVRPGTITAIGFVFGAGACVFAGLRVWPLALGLWLTNRIFDGLDGPVARATGATNRGGFIDIVADFAVYSGFVVGVAVSEPHARLACLVLLFTYYVSGTAFLAFSSLITNRQRETDDRSLHFRGGIAEGAETIIVYVLFCLFPSTAEVIAWAFAVAVGITAIQRVIAGYQLLGSQ